MKSRRAWVGVGVLVLIVAAVVFWPRDRTLPRPAREAIRQRFPNAEVIEAKARTQKGQTVYSVALRQDGRRADVRLTGDGQVTRVVREVGSGDLPRPAADALAAKFPNATYRSIEEVSRVEGGAETVVLYEALVATAARREVEVQVTPDGKIKSR